MGASPRRNVLVFISLTKQSQVWKVSSFGHKKPFENDLPARLSNRIKFQYFLEVIFQVFFTISLTDIRIQSRNKPRGAKAPRQNTQRPKRNSRNLNLQSTTSFVTILFHYLLRTTFCFEAYTTWCHSTHFDSGNLGVSAAKQQRYWGCCGGRLEAAPLPATRHSAYISEVTKLPSKIASWSSDKLKKKCQF